MRCPRPFDTLLVDSRGGVFACECQAWLPRPIGNIQIQGLQALLDNQRHRELQESITDGSYRFCKADQCVYLRGLQGTKDEQPGWDHAMQQANIKFLRIAIDDSCNLRCPSCRTEQILHTSGAKFRARRRMADRIMDYMQLAQQPLTVHIGSDGDPFASLIYRYLLRHAPAKDNIDLSMMTNGLLMKQMYPRVETQFQRLRTLEISMDGATKDTYEKLRLGGNYHKLMSNLHWLNTIPMRHNMEVRLHFVVQPENFREVPTMIQLAEDVGADKVYFNPIQNWGTYGDWQRQNILDPDHPDHAELKNIMHDIMQRDDLDQRVNIVGFKNLF